MALRIGGKNASIILKGADQKIILDLIGEMSAALIAETEREIDAVHQAAQDGWPGNPNDPDPRLYDSSRASNSRRQRAKQYGYNGPRWAPTTPQRPDPGRDPRGSWANLQKEVRLDVEEGVLVGRIWNDVTYAKFIKAVRLGQKSVFVELIRKPMGKMKTRLTKSLVRILTEGFNG